MHIRFDRPDYFMRRHERSWLLSSLLFLALLLLCDIPLYVCAYASRWNISDRFN